MYAMNARLNFPCTSSSELIWSPSLDYLENMAAKPSANEDSDSDEGEQMQFKVIVIGDGAVGKT